MQNSKTVAITLLGETAHFGFCPLKIGFFRGGRWSPRNYFFIGIFILLWLRSPCKNLKSYDTPFLGFEQRYRFRVVIVRFRVVIVRFRVVIVRFRVVIVRFCVVIVGKKCNENSSHYTSAQRHSDQFQWINTWMETKNIFIICYPSSLKNIECK